MSDDIDRANDEVLNRLEATLKSVDSTDDNNNDTGKCIWCGVKVKDKRRWCSAECRDEHIKYANKL
tara:strand:+ start:88 stop:285 length:198 start_codon:yes stop_codon:yes gene_type:complete